MTIRHKLWLIFVLTLVLLTAIGSYTAYIYRTGLQQAADIRASTHAVVDIAHRLSTTLQAGEHLWRAAPTGQPPHLTADVDRYQSDSHLLIESLHDIAPDDDEISGLIAQFESTCRRLTEDITQAHDSPLALPHNPSIYGIQALALLSDISARASRHQAEQMRMLNDDLQTQEHYLLLLLILGCITTLILFRALDRGIGKPAEQATLLAHYDPLTGLPNRTLFHDRLRHAIRRANRTDDTLALLFFDLDYFKSVNDALGHHMGDQLLQEVGERLRHCVRDSDTPARLGGDEFAIIIEQSNDENGILQVAKKVLTAMKAPFTIGKQNAYVSASLGITRYPQDASSAAELLKNADAAMYQAKRRGRNRYHFFTDELNQAARQRLMLESKLRTGLENGHFSLHFQPQVCLRSGHFMGAEALLRFSPDGQFIPPDTFIPVLEETGLMLSVGHWVLEQSCRYAEELRLRHGRDFRMAVNLSARQLQRPDFVDQVHDILKATGLPAHCLEAEITERNLIEAHDGDDTLTRLRKLGVRLAIDDFGTGYSSLSYLKQFSVDLLKIDRSFIHDITQDQDDDAVTSAIIALSHKLDIEVIAEGVETIEQQAFLLQNQCDFAQGYLFSRPLPAADFESWMVKRHERMETLQAEQSPAQRNSLTRHPV